MTDSGSLESLTGDLDADLEEIGDTPLDFDPRVLLSPVIVRTLAGTVIASLVLLWPGRTDEILARLVGLGILTLSATTLWWALTQRPRDLIRATTAGVGVAVSLFIILRPDASEMAVARVVAIVIIAVALRDLWRLLRRDVDGSRTWVLSRSVAMLCLGALLVLFPSEMFQTVTVTIALGWVAISLIVIAVTIDASSSDIRDSPGTVQLIIDWLADRPKSVERRQELYDKILYEGATRRLRVVRFFTLMTFASIIASMGVISDSTAVVIGAMLIAPLMTPLMGMAISLVMGWPHRLRTSALVAAGGIVLAIAIGIVLGLIVPTTIDTTTNAQVVARATPTVIDLITALAAGAAGAYGLSRPDVSDSLPGVAIAISLVPPLSVVGVAYSQADWTSGNGALLLFATNMLAILVMGGITFVATGVTPIQRLAQNQQRVRTALAAVATMAAIVFGALLLNGAQIASDAIEQGNVDDAVREWLEPFPEHTLARAALADRVVTVTIIGPEGAAPTAESLADALADRLGHDVTADLRLVVEERSTARALP